MGSIKLARLVNGILILIGIQFWKPLVYIVGIMMIIAGLTGICLMEKLFNKLGAKGSCS